jgi:hypothetical protein
LRTAHTKGRCFAQEQFSKSILLGVGTKNREQDAWSILFHLDGRVENIQRALRKSLLNYVTENFRVDVIEIRFQDRDRICFPVVE